jgi:Holliday junction DNA helicase RuvB
VAAQINLLLSAARSRESSADHILLAGPPGLGKTTLAMIVAAEMNAPIRITSGPAIQHAGDLASILSSLVEGEILFLDEIHRMSRPAEELLYMAMEDFRVDVIVGKGAGATAIPLSLPHFTLIGATTRAGLLPSPLRDRFGFTAQLDFYNEDELSTIVRRSADLMQVSITDEAVGEIGSIDISEAHAALEMYEVDLLGLDRLDRTLLETLVKKFNGGPVGLTTLAMSMGEEAETLENLAEPFLLRKGLLARTPRGRMATSAAWTHLGLTSPQSELAIFDMPPLDA